MKPKPQTSPFTNTVDSEEAKVGDTLTFTFTVENIGEEDGEASLSVAAITWL